MILLDPHARPVIAHRGNRAHAPEETLPALLEAVALGVDGLEFDLHASRDGQLVLFHDPTLDRTTAESGPVASRTLAELRQIDAGHRFSTDNGRSYPWRGRGATIVSFDEVVDALPRTLPLILELKTSAATEPLRAAIRRHALADRVIVAGFEARAVHPLRGSGFALGASRRDVLQVLPGALLGRAVRPPCEAFCIPPDFHGIPLPIGALVRALNPAGTVVHIWTVNSADEARALWDQGVNGIITDDPAVILAARDAYR